MAREKIGVRLNKLSVINLMRISIEVNSMDITKKDLNGVAVINLSGRLDATSSSDAEQQLTVAIGDGVKMLINMEGVDYISSAGLRVLLVVCKKIRAASGKICLCSLDSNVKDVFEISGFLAVFEIKDSEEEAIALLNS
jgi:anti-anti-sigma factor